MPPYSPLQTAVAFAVFALLVLVVGMLPNSHHGGAGDSALQSGNQVELSAAVEPSTTPIWPREDLEPNTGIKTTRPRRFRDKQTE